MRYFGLFFLTKRAEVKNGEGFGLGKLQRSLNQLAFTVFIGKKGEFERNFDFKVANSRENLMKNRDNLTSYSGNKHTLLLNHGVEKVVSMTYRTHLLQNAQ